jgi:hypothetical protein
LSSEHGLRQPAQFRQQRGLLGKIDRRENFHHPAQRRQFAVTEFPDDLLELRIEHGVAVQRPVGGGTVGAQAVHGHERVAGQARNHRNAAGGLQPVERLPCVDRKYCDDAGRHEQDDRRQQGGDGNSLQHRSPSLHASAGVALPKQGRIQPADGQPGERAIPKMEREFDKRIGRTCPHCDAMIMGPLPPRPV